MSDAANTGTYFSVIAGLSEAWNFDTYAEAAAFGDAQREAGLPVRIFSCAADRDPIAI